MLKGRVGMKSYLIKDNLGNTDEKLVETKLKERFPEHPWRRVVALHRYSDGRLRWYRAESDHDHVIPEIRKKIVVEILESNLEIEVLLLSPTSLD